MDANKIKDDTLENSLFENDPDDGASEASSGSFHSLSEKVDALNIENSEFDPPDFMNAKENSSDSQKTSSEDPNKEKHLEDKKQNKYFIDEDYLKECQVSLTEEEKLKRNELSLQKKNEGNEKFKEHSYIDALEIYTEGLKICPVSSTKERAVLYANRAAARSKLGTEDNINLAIEDCSKAIEFDPLYVKAIKRRANLYQQSDKLDEALKDFERVLELQPGDEEARRAKVVLPPQIEEKNEKLKAEMLSKLKDLGNMVLKPFGLSTNNFQLNQNQETGGYNINFTQNP